MPTTRARQAHSLPPRSPFPGRPPAAVLPGIPDGFPETAHSVHAQRSRVEETDRIPAADECSHAQPSTPTAPPLGRRPPSAPSRPSRSGVRGTRTAQRPAKVAHPLALGVTGASAWAPAAVAPAPPRPAAPPI